MLSHTNAARNEISSKLSNSASGIALTRYPHFVGTIHSFVNEYLSLPWLRSKGVEVRCVDTQIALAKRWGQLPGNRRWALRQANLTETCLIYSQADYGGGKTGNFGPQTPTYQAIVDARRASSEQGYFCFDEMFIWANELLDRHPETVSTLRQRFPLVFIDEAQDNSEAQSALLHRIFCDGDAPSRRQRFGDSNQAIYSSSNHSGATTDLFPGAVVHPMPRSYRFGQDLADHVKGLGVTPQALVGAGPPNYLGIDPKAPAIFLFDDGSVQSVLARYGQHLLGSFDEAALKSGVFTAVAGVHEPGEDDRIPRAMGHYLPTYDPTCARKESAPSSFAQYLARARFETAGSGNTHKLVNATAAALLAASELAGGTHGHIARKSPHRRVIEMLGDSDARANYLALQNIVLMHQGDITVMGWAAEAPAHIEAVVRQLSGVAGLDGDVVRFLAAPQPFGEGEAAIVARSDIRWRTAKASYRLKPVVLNLKKLTINDYCCNKIAHFVASKPVSVPTPDSGNCRGRPIDRTWPSRPSSLMVVCIRRTRRRSVTALSVWSMARPIPQYRFNPHRYRGQPAGRSRSPVAICLPAILTLSRSLVSAPRSYAMSKGGSNGFANPSTAAFGHTHIFK